MPKRSSSYEVATRPADRRPYEPTRSKTFPSYGIYPSGTQDRYIYERSVSSKSNLDSPAAETNSLSSPFSSSTSLSTAFSNSSTVTLQSLAITDSVADTSNGVPSSSPTPMRQPFSAQTPMQIQTSIRGGGDRTEEASSRSDSSSSTTTPIPIPPPVSQSRSSSNQLPTPLSAPVIPSRDRHDSLSLASARISREGQVNGRRNSPEGETRGVVNTVSYPVTTMEEPRRLSPDRQDPRAVGGPRERRDSLPSTAPRASNDPRVTQTLSRASQSTQERLATGIADPLSRQMTPTLDGPSSAVRSELMDRSFSRLPPGLTAPQGSVSEVPPGFVKQMLSKPSQVSSILPTSTAPNQDQTNSRPLPSPPRRNSDEERNVNVTLAAQPRLSNERTIRISAGGGRCVRWNENLICPSPVLPHQRRKGWFNRRGDQLWTNEGAYKPPPSGHEFPLDLEAYPEYGEGWMNEEGVRIDMRHRLVPKQPLRSALKRSKVRDQNTELNARIVI